MEINMSSSDSVFDYINKLRAKEIKTIKTGYPKVVKRPSVSLVELHRIMNQMRFSWLSNSIDAIDELDLFEIFEDEGNAAGYAVFANIAASSNGIYLIDMSINPDSRNKGLGKMLAEQSIDYYMQNNHDYVLINLLENDTCQKFFTSLGFEYQYDEITLKYQVQQVCESALGKNMDHIRPILEQVKLISELDPDVRERISREVYEKLGKADIEKFDPDLTVYYVYGGEVLAIMAFEIGDDNSLFMVSCYINEERNEANMVTPAVLAKIIEVQRNRDIYDSISMFFWSYSQVDSMEKFFGKPSEKVVARVYYYLNGGKQNGNIQN